MILWVIRVKENDSKRCPIAFRPRANSQKRVLHEIRSCRSVAPGCPSEFFLDRELQTRSYEIWSTLCYYFSIGLTFKFSTETSACDDKAVPGFTSLRI